MDRRARSTRLVAGGLIALLLLLALGSVVGAPLIRPPQGESTPAEPFEPPEAQPEMTQDTAPPAEEDGEVDPPFDARVILLLALAVIAVGLFLLLRLLLRAAMAARARSLEPAPEIDAVDLLEQATDEQAQERIMAMGDPRNAVVAAWIEVEKAVSVGGVERQPWQTSTDLVAQVVSDLGVDPAPLVDLGARYRAARFSDHEIRRADVEAAVALLVEVHTGLTRRARADARTSGPATATTRESDSGAAPGAST